MRFRSTSSINRADIVITSMNEEADLAIWLSKNVTALAKARCVSLSMVAARTSINKTTLHNYANGILPRNILSIIKLANFFEVSISDLLLTDLSKSNYSMGKSALSLDNGAYELTIRIEKVKKL